MVGRARRIPDTTIRRLPAYLRVLELTHAERITSVALGKAAGFSSEQVRKDFAYFGAFGTRGVGYEVAPLVRQIRRILGIDRGVRVMVVGAGHLGTALVRYTQNNRSDTEVVAVVDVDPQVIGTAIGPLRVEDVRDLERLVKERQIALAVLTVPDYAARSVAERLADAGVRAILNFAPVAILTDRPEVIVKNIDLMLELQALAYFVKEGRDTPAEMKA
ncbi:MAG: redox-sensing transcriptional repressor Rex [Firmicutes bacterium]|nr:redox-sensing transcriptional repressor Rex [Alicyclobacillaceae bacterium]MCL6497491.1 redox-sensing transcriptional repressor Rex [Bacillota bacterium]